MTWVCGDCGYRPLGNHRPVGSCFGCRGDFTWVADCPECEGRQGRSFTFDDADGIRHEEWATCEACGGTGTLAPASGDEG